MIVAVDLDDTLYDERTFVESGFRAVASHLERTRGLPAAESFAVLCSSLDSAPRGRQIDDLLAHWGLRGKQLVWELVHVYRHHRPSLSLPDDSRAALDVLQRAGHRLYLVTDGHKVVQANKVAALGVSRYFEHCYLTNRYGVAHNKPSPRVFELMLQREGAAPSQLVYVGDDPAKDFVGVRRLGGHTIRVRTGRHAAVTAASAEFDADVEVGSFAEVPAAVDRLADSA